MSANRLTALALIALLAPGCASESGLKDGAFTNYLPSTPTDGSGQVRIDMYPAQTVDGSGQITALPQTVGPFDRIAQSLALGTVDLVTTGTISGTLTADAVTPWADSAGLPTEPGPVDADIVIRKPNSVQNYVVHTDDLGEFRAVVVPSETPYEIAVVPTDPGIPFVTRSLAFRSVDEILDLDIDYGVPLYGRVLTGTGEPLQGARVRATDELGVTSATARTDAAGWYMLRVRDGRDYTVECIGRDHGRDPILTLGPVTAEADLGGRVDFEYPDLAGSFKVGRVVDSSGSAIPGVVVQFTATALAGYEGLDAELVVEDISDANGSFEVSLVDGEYEVALLPPQDADPTLDHGSLVFATESSGAEPSLGNIELPPLVTLSGAVVDRGDQSVGAAQITCTEIGLGGRSWSTFAADDGAYELLLPPSPVRCLIKPPGALASRLAWTSVDLDPSTSSTRHLEVREGIEVTGVVQLGGAPESFTLVEIRDSLGVLLGSTLTAAESEDGPAAGSFSIRVDLPEN